MDLAIQLALWPPYKVVTVTDRKPPWAPSSHPSDPVWPARLGLGPVGMGTCRPHWDQRDRRQICEL